jgi:hypothetical protein
MVMKLKEETRTQGGCTAREKKKYYLLESKTEEFPHYELL